MMTSPKRLKTSALNAAVWIVVATGSSVCDAGAATDAFTFRYAPPPDTRIVQTYLMTRERSVEGLAPQLDTAESKAEFSIRKSGDDYEIVAKPVSTVMKKDHELIEDPVSAILADIEPTYVVGADGQVKDVRGFASVAERLAKALPPGVVEALASLISESAMVEREKADWLARYGVLAGRTFRIGDIVETKLPHRLPNGETVELSLQTYFTRWEPCPAGQCVRIDISYESDAVTDAAAAPPAVSAPVPAPVSASAPDSAASASASAAPSRPLRRVSGSTSRLMDPQTMRLYAEQQTKTTTMPIDVPERGKQPAVFREQSRYEFAYQ